MTVKIEPPTAHHHVSSLTTTLKRGEAWNVERNDEAEYEYLNRRHNGAKYEGSEAIASISSAISFLRTL
jgi:hypothetical protein